MVVPSRNAIPRLTPSRRCARCSRRSQTPWRLQRLKVCAAIHHGPRCGGMRRHFAPLSCRQTIASMVRRRLPCSVLWPGGTARSAVPAQPIGHLSKRHHQFHLSWPEYWDRPQELTDPSTTMSSDRPYDPSPVALSNDGTYLAATPEHGLV